MVDEPIRLLAEPAQAKVRTFAARNHRNIVVVFATLGSIRLRIPVPAALLSVALSCQRFLCAPLLAGLQIERVPLDLLDDVFIHDLSLEALERALQALALVKLNFCQRNHLVCQFGSTPKRSTFRAGRSLQKVSGQPGPLRRPQP